MIQGFYKCGDAWEYCNGECRKCSKNNVSYSDNTSNESVSDIQDTIIKLEQEIKDLKRRIKNDNNE